MKRIRMAKKVFCLGSCELCLLSVSATFLIGCGQKSNADSGAVTGPQTVAVHVLVAQPRPIASTTEYLSILKSRHSATLNPLAEGQVTKILVKSGDRAKAGDPLMQIDPLKQEAAVNSQEAARAAQEANVQYAKLSLDRAQKLFDAGVIPKQDYDNARTSYDAAEAQLKSLQQQVQEQTVQLHYYLVTAPMNGIVGDIPVRVGDRVTFSTVLTTVDEPGALEAYIYVPAARGRDLRLGLPVKLLDENGNPLAEAKITFVSPQVDTDTQTVLAKAAIPNLDNRFRIAQQVRAQITWGTREGQVIPVLAVQRINGQFFAFSAVKEANGTVARQRSLQLGDIVGNDYTVLAGINPGDHIIVSGLQFLQDGMPVKEQLQASAGGSQDAVTQQKTNTEE